MYCRCTMNPQLSVIVPTYRRPALLAEALQSILAQQVDLEVIVVDDSPDLSARPVAEAVAAQGVQYVAMDPPTGGKPSLVRNRGAQQARGRILHFLDDDDVVLPNAYAEVLATAQDRPSTGVFIGKVVPFGPDPAVVERERRYFAESERRVRKAPESERWLTVNLLLHATPMVNSAGFVRREAFDSVGGYDPEMPVNEDVEFYMRAVRRAGGFWMGREVVKYRVGNPSLMHGADGAGTGDSARLNQAYLRMHRKYRQEHGAAEFYALKVFDKLLVW